MSAMNGYPFLTKKAIAERLRVDPAKVHVIPPGIDAPPAAADGFAATVCCGSEQAGSAPRIEPAPRKPAAVRTRRRSMNTPSGVISSRSDW